MGFTCLFRIPCHSFGETPILRYPFISPTKTVGRDWNCWWKPSVSSAPLFSPKAGGGVPANQSYKGEWCGRPCGIALACTKDVNPHIWGISTLQLLYCSGLPLATRKSLFTRASGIFQGRICWPFGLGFLWSKHRWTSSSIGFIICPCQVRPGDWWSETELKIQESSFWKDLTEYR